MQQIYNIFCVIAKKRMRKFSATRKWKVESGKWKGRMVLQGEDPVPAFGRQNLLSNKGG